MRCPHLQPERTREQWRTTHGSGHRDLHGQKNSFKKIMPDLMETRGPRPATILRRRAQRAPRLARGCTRKLPQKSAHETSVRPRAAACAGEDARPCVGDLRGGGQRRPSSTLLVRILSWHWHNRLRGHLPPKSRGRKREQNATRPPCQAARLLRVHSRWLTKRNRISRTLRVYPTWTSRTIESTETTVVITA